MDVPAQSERENPPSTLSVLFLFACWGFVGLFGWVVLLLCSYSGTQKIGYSPLIGKNVSFLLSLFH
jgi:hypothetical protein